MSHEDLNKRAHKRFEELKHKKGWTKEIIEKARESGVDVDEEKLQKMLDSTPSARTIVDNIVHHAQGKVVTANIDPLAFIDSLGLSANLSIAVACIIASKKDGGKSLVKAAEYLEKEIRNG